MPIGTGSPLPAVIDARLAPDNASERLSGRLRDVYPRLTVLGNQRKGGFKGMATARSEGVRMPRAFVLAGGFGLRLRSVVADLPKVLAPVDGRPFLDVILRQLARDEVRHVTLCTGYGEAAVRRFCGDGIRLGTGDRVLALN